MNGLVSLLGLAAFLVLFPVRAKADTADSWRLQLRHAHSLLSQGDAGHAIREFRRLLFFSNSTLDSLLGYSGMSDAYEALQDYGSASDATAIALGLSQSLGQEYGKARDSIQSSLHLRRDALKAAMGFGLRGNTFSALIIRNRLQYLAQNKRWDEAASWLKQNAKSCAGDVQPSLDSLDYYQNNPGPSPFLASLGSALVPGFGQLYLQHPTNAVKTLTLNALTGYGFVHGYLSHRLGDMILYAWLFERFYSGGITVAGTDAQTERETLAENRARNFQAQIPSLCPD